VRILIVEDDFASRRLMQKLLSPYGACEVVVDGEEAVGAFTASLENEQPYDLVCLDIMLPRMDGQQVLKRIREEEERRGILGRDGTKVIMTTALSDTRNIISAFHSQCEGYVTKPVSRERLLSEIKELGLLKDEGSA
jgi:two-component system, chemotaxis family, chemotaxis protein CheY